MTWFETHRVGYAFGLVLDRRPREERAIHMAWAEDELEGYRAVVASVQGRPLCDARHPSLVAGDW